MAPAGPGHVPPPALGACAVGHAWGRFPLLSHRELHLPTPGGSPVASRTTRREPPGPVDNPFAVFLLVLSLKSTMPVSYLLA